MFHAWVEKRLGEEKLGILREKAYNVDLGKEIRRTRGKGEIAEHFEQEYNDMLEIRKMEKKEVMFKEVMFVGWR